MTTPREKVEQLRKKISSGQTTWMEELEILIYKISELEAQIDTGRPPSTDRGWPPYLTAGFKAEMGCQLYRYQSSRPMDIPVGAAAQIYFEASAMGKHPWLPNAPEYDFVYQAEIGTPVPEGATLLQPIVPRPADTLRSVRP